MSTEAPRVSVLMTLFNREAFVADAIKSVLRSTFEDFELLVVDDCSSDNSVSIVRNLAASDSRIRLTCNGNNLGDYGNRMKAAGLARGEFLKYVDSDDQLYPHSLQFMVDGMMTTPEVAFAVCHSEPEVLEPYPWVLSPEESYRNHFLGRGCFACGPTGAIIRRAAFENIGGFRPEWKVLSDIDLWFRLGARHHVALLPPGLVWWRRHAGQEFTTNNAAEFYLEHGFQLLKSSLEAPDCPLTELERRTAIDRAAQHHARRLLSLATRGKSPRKAFVLFRRSGLSLKDLAAGVRPYA